MFCPKCGKELPENIGYCSYCGENLNRSGGGWKFLENMGLSDMEQPIPAIFTEIGGFLCWLIMMLLAPLDPDAANVYWDSWRPLIWIFMGIALVLWSNKLFKKYMEKHSLTGSGKKFYRVLRIVITILKMAIPISLIIMILAICGMIFLIK